VHDAIPGGVSPADNDVGTQMSLAALVEVG
jgi:hypothetical protein